MTSMNIENYDPEVGIAGGLNSDLPVDFSGAATVALPAGTTINGSSLTALGTITSSSAQALAVGLNGLTNPAFNIDASTGSQAAGLNVVGATAAGTVAVAVISSGAAANLTLNALGTGTIGIGSISTGAVTITPATTITGLATLTGGITSAGKAILKSGTAVPATAGAVAAGVPIQANSNGMTIEWTTDAPTHARPKGSLCINIGGSSVSTRLYVATDAAGTWTAITTAA